MCRILAVFSKILLSSDSQDDDWAGLVDIISIANGQGYSVTSFAQALGLDKGVTGYLYHTVPVAVHDWPKHFGGFEEALSAALTSGGDTDILLTEGC